MSAPQCSIYYLGSLDYREAWHFQKEISADVSHERRSNVLLLLEHPNVYTMGRTADRQQVLLNDHGLVELSISLIEVDRGGKVTYHGPGQLVAYPIVALRGVGGPLRYVRALERVIIMTLAHFGIDAQILEGLTGVWVNDEKIAAIGVKISRGISSHGLSINVNTDLSYFDHIIPCGIEGRGVTSMQKVLGGKLGVENVAACLGHYFCKEFGFEMVMDPDPIEAKTFINGLTVNRQPKFTS